MPKYVAFLRAINVGGHTVKMARLRDLFVELGFANVETFIASGNVIFDSQSKAAKRLEQQIEKHLHQALGYPVATFLRTTEELSKVADFQPFKDANADGNQLYVAFAGSEPSKDATRTLLSKRSPVDDYCVKGRDVYWLYRRTSGESGFQAPPLEKVLGMQVTLRNVNTVRRIVAKYS